MKDYLNDMIVRIRNNSAARVPYVFMHPYLPKRYLKILNILYREGYIRGYSEHFAIIDGKPRLSVFLKYNLSGEPIIENIFRVSGQGRKIYIGTKALWHAKNGRGIFIISTPKGLLTDREARLFNVGGEVLLGVY